MLFKKSEGPIIIILSNGISFSSNLKALPITFLKVIGRALSNLKTPPYDQKHHIFLHIFLRALSKETPPSFLTFHWDSGWFRNLIEASYFDNSLEITCILILFIYVLTRMNAIIIIIYVEASYYYLVFYFLSQ